jgi:AbiEi antitoxin C-terminal domain
VLTREVLREYLAEVNVERDVDAVIRELVKLEWLRAARRNGVWLFVAPGETKVSDPYVELRAWVAHDDAVFTLAGEAAAWHLGYLDRRHHGPIPIWIPDGVVPPFGMRSVVSVVRLGWHAEMVTAVQPSRAFLRRRRLDLTDWASRIPAFGPDALLVQLAVRPSSFRPWMDLVAHLDQFTNDCDADTVCALLDGKTASAWQRAAYLLDVGGNRAAATVVFDSRPHSQLTGQLNRPLTHVTLGDGLEGVHVSRFGITDRLVAPLVAQVGKA